MTKNGAQVAIEPQSLRLLVCLIHNRDRVVSRDDLLQAIWHGRAINDWAISGAIKAVRVALEDVTPDKVYVRTIHSRGYRFVAAVNSISLVTTDLVPTILVRVFRMLGEDAELSYLAEGMIIAQSRSKDWRVLSYNTSRAMSGLDPAPDQGITTVIDGGIRQIGDRIRINVAKHDSTNTHHT